MKYPNWMGEKNQGRVEALLNILGEPNAEGVLSDELDVEFRPAERIFFNRNGRRIPPRGITAAVCDPNPNFRLEQPEIEIKLGERLACLVEFFPVGTKFLPGTELLQRIGVLLESIQQHAQVANALKGPHFIVSLPQMETGDLGEFVETCVESAGRSYEQQFSGRKFNNNRRGTLARQVTVVDDSHERLLEILVKGPTCGVLTVPLQGYSVFAQREQMAGLPKLISLAGLEFAVAMTAFPETLARDFNTPGLDHSAYQWQRPESSLRFKAYDGRLVFDAGAYLGSADVYYSGGLFSLG